MTFLFGFRIRLIVCKLQIFRQNCDIPCLTICDQSVSFVQLFSTVLKRFCPLDSKNVFVLVLAHLEPELELFEVDDIGDDGDDDL